MVKQFNNILTSEQISYILDLEEVQESRSKIESGVSMVYFSSKLTESIKQNLQEGFGIDIPEDSDIPLRWIKGDIGEHVDTGLTDFQNTYLMYLTDSQGEFMIDDVTYPIHSNTGFIFNEGVKHKTQNTGSESRLLIGPMSELLFQVGGPNGIYYCSSLENALEFNSIGYTNTYVVGDILTGTTGGFTSWRIAPNSYGPSSQSIVYTNGSTLDSSGGANYYLYPTIPCFLEGSKILCSVDDKETYVKVEDLRKDSLVKTNIHGYKKVVVIGKSKIQNTSTDERVENRLYKCSTDKYPELSEDLIITGCHSILVDAITQEQKIKTKEILGGLFTTDDKLRLMALLDERAEPWLSEGEYTIWHFALENEDIKMNYGVYANGTESREGLLVESCSINFLQNKSNMVFLE